MALTKGDLEAIKALIDDGNKPIEKRLSALEESVAEIKEDTEITRSATNALVQWADTVSSVTQIKFPVEQAK